MIAAAIDNTIGSLCMLVAPPNITRRLEVTCGRPVEPDLGAIAVTPSHLERGERLLHFRADARSADGARVARAKATHWTLGET